MSALKMETVGSIETSVPTYQTTWRHIPKDHNLDSQCHENQSLTQTTRSGMYMM
jgi:hypothetical protein